LVNEDIRNDDDEKVQKCMYNNDIQISLSLVSTTWTPFPKAILKMGYI
jgi:hypothetical protein